ncbi:MAG: DUF1624 domain-containing protein [Acidimicrobiia bacterium]|nr:DUF1624 domain-containing protein [Acidimicrobiia bacterium]
MRRGYLDWLRGVAVLIMIEAHTLDSWTRVEDRGQSAYGWSMVLGGFGAPIFLFLAGVAIALAGGSRLRKGQTAADAAAALRRRGWEIVGLAFLFRLQSWLISGGPVERTILKVDILNIMGLSMLAAALLWAAGRTAWLRALLLTVAAVAVTMLTPIVRTTDLLAPLPDLIEAYLRPSPGRTTFTLFPWGGFLLAGAAVGLCIDAARTDRQERRLNAAFAVIGAVIAAGGYAASYLPPIYEQTNFWTSSPTFFFLRLGILIALLPLAYAWNLLPGRSPLREFGLSSLFVYWIHVEMVYGVLTAPIHRRLPFAVSVLACVLFSVALFGLVKLKERLVRTRRDKSSLQSAPA